MKRAGLTEYPALLISFSTFVRHHLQKWRNYRYRYRYRYRCFVVYGLSFHSIVLFLFQNIVMLMQCKFIRKNIHDTCKMETIILRENMINLGSMNDFISKNLQCTQERSDPPTKSPSHNQLSLYSSIQTDFHRFSLNYEHYTIYPLHYPG